MRYLFRRLLQATFLLIGVSILTFLFSALAPGNYFDEMRLNPQISPETVAALRAQYQLDRPLPVRYARWVNSLLHGELGYSFAYNSPVAPLLWVRARTVVGKRVAQLPVQERIHPSRVAHRQGPVKLILRAQSSDCFRRNLRIQPHLIEIVSRREGRK